MERTESHLEISKGNHLKANQEDPMETTESPLKMTEEIILPPLNREAMEDSHMRTDPRKMKISFPEIDQDSVDLETSKEVEWEEVVLEEASSEMHKDPSETNQDHSRRMRDLLSKIKRDHSDLSEMKMVLLQMSTEDHSLREMRI